METMGKMTKNRIYEIWTAGMGGICVLYFGMLCGKISEGNYIMAATDGLAILVWICTYFIIRKAKRNLDKRNQEVEGHIEDFEKHYDQYKAQLKMTVEIAMQCPICAAKVRDLLEVRK